MRALFVLIAGLALIAAAQPANAFNADSEKTYQSLLKVARDTSVPIDWRTLRFAYADSAEFDLYGARTDQARKAMFKALNAADYRTALAQAKSILDKDFVDIDAHVVADIAKEQLGDKAGAAREHDIVEGLLRSIRTGDGSSPAQAFTVITVGEEYGVLRAFGMQVQGQSLLNDGGHSYDVLKATDAEGKVHTFYFLIDRVTAAEAALLGSH